MIRAAIRAGGSTMLVAFVFAAAVVAGGQTTRADEASDAVGRAESLLAEGKVGEALNAFDGATDAFWSALPLTFRTALFAERIGSYGDYSNRADARFRSGETALVYLEPVGFSWMPDGDGFKTSLETDLEIRSPSGLIFSKAEKFATIDKTSRTKVREINLAIRLTLPALKAGDYELKVTVRDLAGRKTATASLPFAIVE